MKIIKRIFGIVYYSLLSLAMLFSFIFGCAAIAGNGINLALAILLLLTGLFGMGLSALGIISLCKNKSSEVSGSIGLVALAFSLFIYAFLGFTAFEFYDNIELFILTTLHLALIIVAVFINNESLRVAKKVLSIISMSIFIVLPIVFLSLADKNTHWSEIVTCVFLVLAANASIPYYAIFNNPEDKKPKIEKKTNKAEKSLNKDKVYKKTINDKTVIEPVVVDVNSVDTSSIFNQLIELKKLFDAGIITEAEYQEKRAKYVEKL